MPRITTSAALLAICALAGAFTLEITTPPSPPPPNKPAIGNNGCAAGAGGAVGLFVALLAAGARRSRKLERAE